MKRLAIVGLGVLIFTGCSGSAPRAVENSNSNQSSQRNEKMQSVVSHSTENQTPPPGNAAGPSVPGEKTKWTQSGNPIDTKDFDSAIAAAVKAQKAKPKDAAANAALADAYFKRGFALTEARQYASALGDYRRALKYDASNEEAQKWIDMITSIYNSKNQEFPKEGEEPPPLPFKSGK